MTSILVNTERRLVSTIATALVIALAVPSLALAAAAAGAGDMHEHMGKHGATCCSGHEESEHRSAYTRSMVEVTVPEVTLLDASGAAVRLRSALAADDAPIMLNFIFTSCTTICPVLTAAFSQVDEELGEHHEDIRLVSITIDPEHDTPARLRTYAEQHGADARWRFLTGSSSDIAAVQKAFGAYRGSKFNHAPLTYIHKPGAKRWVRLEGLGDAEGLWAEYQRSSDAR